jgi:DNA-binding NtrC family response regulator
LFTDGLRPVHEQVKRILDTDRRLEHGHPPVLIVGETGTGKSLLARHLHGLGPRAERPFVELNCAALPETLVESELFGHERGAFTDAREARIGLFEAASGGTLFLDEISGLPGAAQAKMLIALERNVVRRVGGNREIAVDVRLIAASPEDLDRAMSERRFRPDLYHRLHVLRIDLPPLRRRRDDIAPLAEHFLSSLKRRYRAPQASLSPASIRRLRAYDWPGNVRELAHELERALILSDGAELAFRSLVPGPVSSPTADAEWLAPGWRLPSEGFSLESAQLRFIRLALDQTGGNIAGAARLLGVPRDYVRYRLKKAEAAGDSSGS